MLSDSPERDADFVDDQKGYALPTERNRGSALEGEGNRRQSSLSAKLCPTEALEEETARDEEESHAASNLPKEKKLGKLRPLPVKLANPN